MREVQGLEASYVGWEKEAEPFMRQHGAYRDFMKVSARFKKAFEFSETLGSELAASMKPLLPKFVADQSISHEQLAYLKDLLLYMRKDSPPAWKRITSNARILGNNQLAALFLDDTEDNEVADLSTQQTLEKIVFTLTGRKSDPVLSYNELRAGKESHPKAIEKYIKLRADFNKRFSAALLKFIRLSGKEIVDVGQARSYLNAMGCNRLPIGFVGKVDEKGKLYTSAGKALHGTMIGRMEMNPAYDAKSDDTYYCKLIGDMRGELRTVDFLKHSRGQRHKKVSSFSGNIEQHRKQWIKDFDSLDDKIQICALITEIAHLTLARIGTEGNENNGEPTYGISTWLVKHIKFTTQGAEIRYAGKKGTINHHYIKPTTPSNRRVLKLLKEQCAGKERTDHVWTVGRAHILPRDVNKYIKSLGINVTIHKFRHAAASREARAMLEKSPFNSKNKPTQAQAERWIKAEAEKIGQMLHHRSGSGDKEKVTSSTAFQAYIDPALVHDWFIDLGLRVPKWLPKFDD